MPIYPQQSFQHTLREIAINREDPCELVRELISNAYDAGASEIRLAPFLEKKGLVFFDNGVGLSQAEKDAKNGVVPYVAFFSIGKGTKQKGDGIGYKCQGSKLCFASEVVTIVTRSDNDPSWRWKQVQNPKRQLSERFDLTPAYTDTPWQVLQEDVFAGGDRRTLQLSQMLNEQFFQKHFKTGTLIIIEGFEVEDYAKYFGNTKQDGYLYNYIRFFTAHGDVRYITTEQGFDATEVNAFSTHRSRRTPPKFLFGAPSDAMEIPYGWPYLEVNREGSINSPARVDRLRDSRFWGRYAGNFVYEDVHFSMILALDGHRRALTEYSSLGRRGDARSGITLGSQRGTFLCVQGVRVCSFNELWTESELEPFAELADNQEHYVFLLDGDFELVTNRNAPSPESKAKLRDPGFLRRIRDFLQVDVPQRDNGTYLAELMQRLRKERTHKREALYTEAHQNLLADLSSRASFKVHDVPSLAHRFILEPQLGEEHFVGALYTMFSHIIPDNHPLRDIWIRPLTFRARGIDAVGLAPGALIGEAQTIEYKHTFRATDEFNHPLSLTRHIVCWDFEGLSPDTVLQDSYDYVGQIKDPIGSTDSPFGYTIANIHHRQQRLTLGHKIRCVSLKRLIMATFNVEWMPGAATTSNVSSPRQGRGKRT